MMMKKSTLIFLLSVTVLSTSVPAELYAQIERLDYATFAVEVTGYSVSKEKPGTYGSEGDFIGVGRMTFSLTKRTIQFDGLVGKGTYRFTSDSFTLSSLILMGDTEYAFKGQRDQFREDITGKIIISIPESGGLFSGKVDDFQMKEWGSTYKGVLRGYHLPSSVAAQEMLQKYDDLDFGGVVAFKPN